MRWVRSGRPLEQAQAKIDPPDSEPDDERWRKYQGYPVVMVVKGKRIRVWVYD